MIYLLCISIAYHISIFVRSLLEKILLYLVKLNTFNLKNNKRINDLLIEIFGFKIY